MPNIIHLSDLHFGAHDEVLVEAVERTVDAEKPDLVVISGDFTQRARTDQFEQAGRFLSRLRDAGHDVLGVPGNHDVPLYDVLRRFFSPLTRYRKYIDEALCPFLDLPGMTVIGINTARSLTIKDGHINKEQLAFIRESFAGTDPSKPRVLVTHHPLFAQEVEGGEGHEGMRDQATALEAIAECGVDLLLAGHNHRGMVAHASDVATGAGKALVIQAGTATSTRLRGAPQSLNRIKIDEKGVTVSILDWDGLRFTAADTQKFERHGGHWEIRGSATLEESNETAV